MKQVIVAINNIKMKIQWRMNPSIIEGWYLKLLFYAGLGFFFGMGEVLTALMLGYLQY